MADEISFLHVLNPFIAFGGRSRKEQVESVAEKAVHYASRMSEKVGVDLTDVRVQDMTYLASEHFNESVRNTLTSDYYQEAPVTRAIFKVLAYGLVRPLAELQAMCLEDISPTLSYNPFNQTIYVPYGPITKAILFVEKNRYLDDSVVHELTHHLWGKLGGEFKGGSRFKYWSEGFAFYGQRKWFADLYPEGYKIKYRSREDSFGCHTIEQLVEQQGEEILMKIPREWEEMDKPR